MIVWLFFVLRNHFHLFFLAGKFARNCEIIGRIVSKHPRVNQWIFNPLLYLHGVCSQVITNNYLKYAYFLQKILYAHDVLEDMDVNFCTHVLHICPSRDLTSGGCFLFSKNVFGRI